MTAMDTPLLDAPATGWFKVGRLTEEAIVAFGANPASLYLLLCKRVNYTGKQAGRSAQPYCHTTVAALFGCSRRHLYDCLKTLVDGGAVAIHRTRDGHHVTILGYPSLQSRREPACSSEPAPEQTGTSVPVSESEGEQAFPSRREPACSSLFLIQESKDQEEGEKTPTVVQAAASAPPALEAADETTREAILLGEASRKRRFPEPVRNALVYALSEVPDALRVQAVRGAVAVMAAHPTWNQDAPETWAGQARKAADAKQVKSYRPPPEPVRLPPAVDPERSAAARAAALAMLPSRLRQRNDAIRRRFGVAS